MLNYVALLGTGYLLSGLLKDPSPFVVVAQTPKVLESARIPALFADLRVHWGLILALLLAVGMLVAALSEHDRLRDPHGRPQPERGPLRRHLDRPARWC